MAYLLSIPGFWILFNKLEITAWYSLIQVFNFIVLMKYFEVNLWFLLLMVIQPAGIALLFYINNKIAKSFGEGIGMAFGLSLWFKNQFLFQFLRLVNMSLLEKKAIFRQ